MDGKKVKLQLLDTAGQERFRTITTGSMTVVAVCACSLKLKALLMCPAHYRNAMGILLVYDITNEASFENITEWLSNIEKHTSGNVDRVLIGNKTDMEEKRVRAIGFACHGPFCLLPATMPPWPFRCRGALCTALPSNAHEAPSNGSEVDAGGTQGARPGAGQGPGHGVFRDLCQGQ